MGLYDKLNGSQVYMFFEPLEAVLGDDNKILTYSSKGSLTEFETGDFLPYMKEYYNYGKNFIVWDYQRYVLHLIKNGILKKTFKGAEVLLLDLDFQQYKVFTIYGVLIEIKNVVELLKFKDDYLNYSKEIALHRTPVRIALNDYAKSKRNGLKDSEKLFEKYELERITADKVCDKLKESITNRWGLHSQLNEKKHLISFILYLNLIKRQKFSNEELFIIINNIGLDKNSILEFFKEDTCFNTYSKELLKNV